MLVRSLAMTALLASIATAAASAQTDPAEREQKLHAMLEGASLVGQFTVVGADGVAPRRRRPSSTRCRASSATPRAAGSSTSA